MALPILRLRVNADRNGCIGARNDAVEYLELNIALYHLKTNDMNAIALRRSNWDTRALFGDPPDPEEKAMVGLSSRVYKNKIVVNTLKCFEQNQPEFLQKMYQKR